MPELLKVEEVAEILRSSPAQVKELMDHHGLPYIAGLAKGRLVLDEHLWKWVRLRSTAKESADESREE